MINKVNSSDLKELFKVTDDRRLILYYIQEYERVMHFRFPACSKLKGERVDQSFTILDVKGIGVTDLVGKTKKFLSLEKGSTISLHKKSTILQLLKLTAPVIINKQGHSMSLRNARILIRAI